MTRKLRDFIEEISNEENNISTERKIELDEIVAIINAHLEEETSLDIIVVCTHNSRRSQLGEAWINTLANHLKINFVTAFSGGMEVTAFNGRMVKALNSCGFHINEVKAGANPRYMLGDINFENHPMFSKVYNDTMNPQSGFMAFMVCDHADENCPIVHGMKYRIPLRYKDPKEFDNTPKEEEAYINKIREVGREMHYLLSRIN